MTTPSRRQVVLLVVLLAVAVGILSLQPFGGSTTGPSAGAGGRGGRASGSVPDTGVPDVRLELLERQQDAFAAPVRNPFRFEGRAKAAATGPVRTGRAGPPPPPAGPPPEPPPPPIPLRFIGFLQPDGTSRIAVLSDGRGTVIDAKEGDVVEGRYRLLRVGNDSADLVYLDGRGRQTIRLSGQ